MLVLVLVDGGGAAVVGRVGLFGVDGEETVVVDAEVADESGRGGFRDARVVDPTTVGADDVLLEGGKF